MGKNLIRNIIILVLLVGFVALYFVYNKPHRDIINEDAKFSMTLKEMNEEFVANEELAYTKFFNQIVEISGIAESIDDKGEGRYDIVLQSDGITANGEIIQTGIQPETLLRKKVLLKGLYIGYDNLLGEIKLSECSIKRFNTN